jgi:hypothetical protein
MAKAISNMFVAVGGDIDSLAASFDAGARRVQGFVGHLDYASRGVAGFSAKLPKLTSMLGTLGVAFSAASAIGMVKGQLDSVDALAKLSDRTGIATEQLVGLQHAADLAGVSGDELTDAVEKLLKNLAAATNGSKQAGAAFSALGLNAGELIDKSANEALAQVADRLANVENPAQRAAIAMGIFGKSGQGLLPFLMAGSAGIREAQQEVERLGLTISRTDASRIEEANDAITRTQASVNALAREFAVGLAPAIKIVADAMVGYLSHARAFHEAMGGADMFKQVAALQDVRDRLDDVTQAANAARVSLDGANGSTPANQAKAYDDYLGKLREQLRVAKQIDEQAASTKAAAIQAANTPPWYVDAGSYTANRLPKAQALPDSLHTPKFYEDLTAKIKEAEAWTQQIEAGQASAAAQAREATAAQEVAARAQADAMKEQERRTQAVSDRVADLRSQYEQLGMSDSQKALHELKSQGANPQQLAQAATYLGQLDQAKAATEAAEEQRRAQEDLRREAERYYAETMTPAEKYADEIQRINDLLAAGALDPTVAARAAEQAQKALAAAQPKAAEIADNAPRLASAIRANSAEAQALRFTGGNNLRGAAAEATAKNTASMLAAQGKANGHLATIAGKAGKSDEIVIDFA